MKDLLNLKIFHSDDSMMVKEIQDGIIEKDAQFPLLEEVNLTVRYGEDEFIKRCPNLKKATFIEPRGGDRPVAVFNLNHLSKLEEIHIRTSKMKGEDVTDLSKLPNLTHVWIDADVYLGDKPNPIDDLIRLPKLQSLACKSELMTQTAYEYAMNNDIKVEIL